jgi:outer membrane protein OmpA-like peptidoglycan-associated protein
MNRAIYPSQKDLIIITVSLSTLLASCVSRPWRPTNVGRESGPERTPLVVSHIPERNQWTLARTKSHNIFQQILCFNYTCRRMIGRNKLRQAISFADFTKQIKKNAKKGAYKNMVPVVPATQKPKRDTIVTKKDTARVARMKPAPAVNAPVLKTDSLITLSEFLFETNSYKLKDEHYSQLDSLSKFLLTHPTLQVNVTGHTDNTGNERHNVTLSMRRAETVALYLINKRVPEDKVYFEGLGSARPIRGNETVADRSKNRRVEILISNQKTK